LAFDKLRTSPIGRKKNLSLRRQKQKKKALPLPPSRFIKFAFSKPGKIYAKNSPSQKRILFPVRI